MFFIKNSIYQKITTDYSWLVILFFILRLYGITDPPLEIQHNWRQCTGLMIARNFLTIDPNIFFPRLDDTCLNSNIVAGEFPLMSYLHYLASLLFGYQHWYGRLINLIISSLGILSFGAILQFFFNKRIVWYSVLSLLVSPWLIYSRKMMPDTFSISLVFIGFWFALNFYKSKKWYNLVFFFIFSTLGCLAKIPAALYFAFFILLFYQLRKNQIRPYFITISLSISVSFFWYFVWGRYLSQHYGNWFNLGKPFVGGIIDIITHPSQVFYNFIFNSFNSYFLFGLLLYGMFRLFRDRNFNLIKYIIIFYLVFTLYIFKAGYFFYHHNYYMIPIIPVFAFVIGYGLANSNNKFILLIFIAGIIESIANQQHDFRIKPDQIYKLELESILNRLDNGEPKSPVLINTQSNPQQLYLANRRGCYISPDQMQDSNMLNSYKEKGYRWMVIDKYYENANSKKEIIYQDKHFIVYKL